MEFNEAFDPFRAFRHGWAALKLAPFPLFVGALAMWFTAGNGGAGNFDDVGRAIIQLQEDGSGGGSDAPSYDNFDDWGERLGALPTSLNDLVGRVQDMPPELQDLLDELGSGGIEAGMIFGIVGIVLLVSLFCGGIMMVIRSFVHTGYLRLHEQLVREGAGDFGPLFSGADLLIPMVLWKLLKTAIVFGSTMVAGSPGFALVMVGAFQQNFMLIGLGALLLIALFFPALIYVQLGLALGAHCLVLERLSPMQALERSWSLASGHRWELFIFLFAQALVSLGGILAGLLACCVGMFVTVPITMATIDVGMTEAFLLYTVDQATRDSFRLPTLAEEMV
ncbi:MAG: hypothetical protein RIT28_2594 [Pseudomonadota bacterium]